MIRDKFPNFFSYRDWFDNLAERFTKATTETEKQQAMALIRQRADHILRHDYPNLRRPPVPAPKEQTETAVTSVGKPARQLPDVAKKLAAHSKKENRAETVDYHAVRQICNMVKVDLDLIII